MIDEDSGVVNFTLTYDGEDRYHLIADEDFRLFAKRCYTQPGREKTIPHDVRNASRKSLESLLDGLMASDGSTSATGKQVYTTTSAELAGQVQEIALKIGRAATIRTRTKHDDVHFGAKPVHYVTIFRERRLRPKIGWTTTRRTAAAVTRVSAKGRQRPPL